MSNSYMLEKYISEQTGAIEEMAEFICEYAVKAIADMVALAKDDMGAYFRLRDIKEIRIPFISMGRFIFILRKCGDIFDERIEHLGHIHFIYTRGCKEYGIQISDCIYDEDRTELLSYGFGMRISPYLGKYSFELTKETIIHQFIDKEIGKERADIQARYMYDGEFLLHKGARFVPNYDSMDKLVSVKI